MHIIGVSEVEKKEGTTEKLFEERFVENFPKMLKINNLQIQVAQWAPITRNIKKWQQTHHNQIAIELRKYEKHSEKKKN